MANPIIQFLKGLKTSIKSKTSFDTGALYLTEDNDGKNASYLYYAPNASTKINIAPECIESQSETEVVIAFEE